MMLFPLSSADDGADAAPPAVILRGTRAGLEIVVDGEATLADIGAALTARLEQSPGFFAGNDVVVRVEGRLPAGALARLEEVTGRFDLRIVEVAPQRAATEPGVEPEPEAAAPEPIPEPVAEPEITFEVDIDIDAEEMPPEPPAAGPRLLVGPVRSGVVLDAPTDLVILGDVNPGAEIQAAGNIIVLGRLRGIAHAAVGGQRGFILALRLEPQQLRIGTLVARAGDADRPAEGAEIAYATGRTIVVERYQGRLPGGLSTAA